MLAALAAFAALGAGCPDPEAEFESFESRYEDIHGNTTASVTTGGGACDFEMLEGEYLFALATSLLPTSPVMFRTTVTVDGSTVSLVFQPLKAKDKTTAVGDPIAAGPFDVATEGGFVASLGTLNIIGAANPLTGSDIVANDVVLTGSLCTGKEAFICGTVAGRVTSPTMLDLAPASTFGMVKIVDGALPEKTTLDCSGKMGTY